MSTYVKKRRSYTQGEKKKVLNELMQSGNTVKTFSKKINVPAKTLYKWHDDKKTIMAVKKENYKKKKIGNGKKNILSNEIENEILKWILDIRLDGLPVPGDLIKNRARYMVKKHELNIDCNFGDGWLQKFINRHDLVLRKKSSTIVTQEDCELIQITSFIELINDKIKNDQYDAIINIDESGIYYDQHIGYTYEEEGTKRVDIISTGREKQRVSVIFGIDYLENLKLKPLIIMKGKTKRCLFGIPSSDEYILSYQENSWCDENQFMLFLEQLPKDKKILLMCDNFRGHITNRIIEYIKNELPLVNYNLLPPNTTSILQPLDVGVNKPIKSNIKNQYIEWLIDQFENQQTLLGINKLERNKLLIKWIINGWKSINIDTIKKSFESCGYGDCGSTIPMWKRFYRLK